MSLPAGPSGEVASVMWREGTWRCDFCNAPGRPVFQLYDREILELEQCVAEDNFTAISEMMREAVRRIVASRDVGVRGDTDAGDSGVTRRSDLPRSPQ